jgi:hypothetical protein
MKTGSKEGWIQSRKKLMSGRSLSIRKRVSALTDNEQLKLGRVVEPSLLWEAAAEASCKHRLTLTQI